MSDHMPDRELFGIGTEDTPRPTAEEIEQLKELGRQRGHVTLDQIKTILPVELMSSEELGRAMARLESAGIDVQIDPEFLRSRADTQSAEKLRHRQAGPSKTDLGDIRSTQMLSPMSNSQPVPRARRVTRRWTGGTSMTGLVVLIMIVVIVCAILIYGSYWR